MSQAGEPAHRQTSCPRGGRLVHEPCEQLMEILTADRGRSLPPVVGILARRHGDGVPRGPLVVGEVLGLEGRAGDVPRALDPDAPDPVIVVFLGVEDRRAGHLILLGVFPHLPGRTGLLLCP